MSNRSITIVLLLVAAVAAVLAVFSGPKALAFWPLENASDFLQRITPLFLVALFVERALEVFMTAWRGQGEKQLKVKSRHVAADGKQAADLDLTLYKTDTQRIAFSAGIALGVIISAVGIRSLSLFIYGDDIDALTGWQRSLFTAVDVLVTGAVIGGGADGLHKIVKVFLGFMDTTSANIDAKKPIGPDV
jgi:hypothetical protein